MDGPDIFQFLDYRLFLRAFLASNPRIGQNGLARVIGLSKSMLSFVLSGRRDLDPSRVGAVCAALELDADESHYFAALVDLEDPSRARRKTAWKEVTAARRFRAAGPIRDDAVRLFSHWSFGAIWKLARCAGFRADVDWIKARLDAPLGSVEVVDAIDGLVALGLLVPGPNGELTALPEDRLTLEQVPPGRLSEALREWHRWHLDHLATCLTTVPGTDRMVLGATLAVGPEQVEKIRARTKEFLRDVAAISAEATEPDRVYQVEVGVAPLARPQSR